MYIDVSGPGTVQFQWKVSSQLWCDYLEFRVDGAYRGSLTGDQDWQQATYTITGTGSHQLKWRYYKDSSDSEGDDRGYVKAVTFTPPALPTPDYLAQAVDSELVFTTGGLGLWWRQTGSPSYYDGDCACSGGISDGDEPWMQTTVAGAGTVTFWWKVSSESGCDCLEFYLDGQLQSGRISGEEDWAQKTYTIASGGTHTIQWRYQKSQYDSAGSDCGWVDEVQWSGAIPEDPSADDWGSYVYNAGLTYTYDPSGRRIAKSYDGITVLKYVYDGDHCIAEYDSGGTLRRKYIYGPDVDQPVCMIESTQTYAGTYYYHFDASGSVVALTNSSGNTVEVYDYSVYGQVGASDASHPNRFMFTGREFDKETGLYYYRARYYKPEIGRFLQADQVGYEAGMNLYRYCSNNPWNLVDPYGADACEPCSVCPDRNACSGPPPSPAPPSGRPTCELDDGFHEGDCECAHRHAIHDAWVELINCTKNRLIGPAIGVGLGIGGVIIAARLGAKFITKVAFGAPGAAWTVYGVYKWIFKCARPFAAARRAAEEEYRRCIGMSSQEPLVTLQDGS